LSLLLDALKRAEQEKLTRQGDRPNASAQTAPALVGTPRAANAASAAVLELQPVPGDTATTARGADLHAAQAVFKAKAAQEPVRNRGALWAGAAAAAVVLLAAAAYVWYSINSLAPPLRTTTRLPRPAPILPPASDPDAPRAHVAFVPPAAPADAAGTPVGAAPVSAAPAGAPEAATATARRAPRSAADELLAQQPIVAAQDTVKLTRAEETRPRIPQDVAAGYRALVAGDLATARARYAAALAADATNVDALLGLAAAEARAGEPAAAAQRYRRALELDPQNATAIAGIAALADYARPDAVERELRADLYRHPDSPALHFTLGNLYAQQGRWGEAQAAFFEAFRLDPASADIAFNLAVTLDHLGSRKPAADFYRRAIALARAGARQFDPAQAEQRLAVLEQR
jgi:tetratricopeptide (TPR) repeat protein